MRRCPAPNLALALLTAALALMVGICAPGRAHAQVTCTAAGPSLTFGTVNPYTGFPYVTSGAAAYACTNTGNLGTTVYACLSVGTGSGGISATNRALASGASTLPVQITGGILFPSQIGNGTSYPMEGPAALLIGANATANNSLPMVAAIPAPGSAPPPGAYSSSFSGADAQLFYSTPLLLGLLAPVSCAALVAGPHSVTQANFSITATVPVQCTVSAGSLAFPTAATLMHTVSAAATISVTCNASTPVTVALDYGATGTGPTTRQMKWGANAITYGIYRDAGATLPWGNTAGTDTASLSSGTGTLTAYGLVPAQPSPPPGLYVDVVNVVITY